MKQNLKNKSLIKLKDCNSLIEFDLSLYDKIYDKIDFTYLLRNYNITEEFYSENINLFYSGYLSSNNFFSIEKLLEFGFSREFFFKYIKIFDVDDLIPNLNLSCLEVEKYYFLNLDFSFYNDFKFTWKEEYIIKKVLSNVKLEDWFIHKYEELFLKCNNLGNFNNSWHELINDFSQISLSWIDQNIFKIKYHKLIETKQLPFDYFYFKNYSYSTDFIKYQILSKSDIILHFKELIKYSEFLQYQKLDESFLSENIGYFDFLKILEYQHVSFEFILKHKNKTKWHDIIKLVNIDYEKFLPYFDEILAEIRK